MGSITVIPIKSKIGELGSNSSLFCCVHFYTNTLAKDESNSSCDGLNSRVYSVSLGERLYSI